MGIDLVWVIEGLFILLFGTLAISLLAVIGCFVYMGYLVFMGRYE